MMRPRLVAHDPKMMAAVIVTLFACCSVMFDDGIAPAIFFQLANRPPVIERAPHIKRTRACVIRDIFMQLGPHNTRRAYRMKAESFEVLYGLLAPILDKKNYYEYTTKDGSRKRRRIRAPNGLISSRIRLSAAIRFLAGGSIYDIGVVHGISTNDVYNSVWSIVDAVNECKELDIVMPSCHLKQEEMAKRFGCRSAAGFNNVVAAIDGLLIWTEKPNKTSCEAAGFGPAKFYCGRKNKYGLNMMGTVDYKARFVDVEICHPASTSDYLAFANSSLKQRLDDELLKPGLVIFGDNAYVNSSYLATPFRAAGGSEDDYNFFHSQLRITVERAFGMLVHRWGVLRRPLHQSITITKVSALVMCLCKLHNFCIDQNDTAREPSVDDAVHRILHNGMPLSRRSDGTLCPDGLLHANEQPSNLQESRARTREERSNRYRLSGDLPRTVLHRQVVDRGLRRPAQ